MSSKNKTGNCAICSQYGHLTFEHVPPKAAFNNQPIFMQGHDHLIDESNLLYGKGHKSNKGFGEYTLCQNCNNLTGAWYGSAFVDFVKQGKRVIEGYKVIDQIVEGEYQIKPLNVIKQILSMFMSADKSGFLRSQKDLVQFILNREETKLPQRFNVFLYSTLSKHRRMFGYAVVRDPILGLQKWSEINFPPYGYFLTENSLPPNKAMVDITTWGNCIYDQLVSMEMTTGYLSIKGPILGIYGK